MSKPVELHPAAELELVEAARWYEERAGLGTDLLDEVLATRARAEEFFDSYSPVPEVPGVRLANVHRFPYHLVCYLEPERILILAVAHVRRRPRYWRHRLDD